MNGSYPHENLIYKGWVTQGFLVYYQKGTPDEIWDLIVRDLKWIQDQLHSFNQKNLSRKFC